jgi:hypothetical protein
VQDDPIKSTLKAPGAMRLKLNYDEPLWKFAFKCSSRRYPVVVAGPSGVGKGTLIKKLMDGRGRTLLHFSPRPEPFLPLKPPNISQSECVCSAEKLTRG